MEDKEVSLPAPSSAESKSEWLKPEVVKLEAGSAEGGDTIVGDGGLFS